MLLSSGTKSYKSAVHASKSVSQRLEDYWLGLRLQKIDIPALELVKSDDVSERDRLRVVECPSDIIDSIGGWTTTGIGQRYGSGQPLEVKAKWMSLLVDQD